MRVGILFLQIAAILLAQPKSDISRWNSWQSQYPEVNIAEVPLPAADRAAVEATIIKTLKRDDRTLSEDELRQLAQATQLKLLDLTGDGVPEVIAEGRDQKGYLCSPTGNCPWWVLRKEGTRYLPILEDIGKGLSTDCRPKQRPCAIAVFMHGSATETTIREHRMSNGRYRVVAEYEYVWPLDENGETAKKPIVTRVH